TIAPTVTINQASTQADPTNAAPIHFTVVFSETVTGFGTNGVSLGGTASPSSDSVSLVSGTTYDVAVGGMASNGTVTASIKANAAHDAAGNNTTPSSSPNSPVSDHTIAPTVTINQATGQADPTNGSPIHFTVVFSEAVTGFGTSNVVLGGTASPASDTISLVS